MKGFTVLLQFGWCGFGFEGGLIPEARFGLVRFACCRGWLVDVMAKFRRAINAGTQKIEALEGRNAGDQS